MEARHYRAPNPGDVVSFVARFKNPGYGVPDGARETEPYLDIRYDNVMVLPPFDWMTSAEFAVPAESDAIHFPVAVINVNSLVSLSCARINPAVGADRVMVKSSSDPRHFYRVTIENGTAVRCTCPGFAFRGRCRHLKEAEQCQTTLHSSGLRKSERPEPKSKARRTKSTTRSPASMKSSNSSRTASKAGSRGSKRPGRGSKRR